MPIIIPTNSAASGGDLVPNSIRMEGANREESITRTLGTASNRKKWTLSTWLKTSISTASSTIMQGGGTNRPTCEIVVNSNYILIGQYNGSAYDFQVGTAQALRDHSAWYHILLQYDSTQGTAANRIKWYINGVLATINPSSAISSYPSQNFEPAINSATLHALGGSIYGGTTTGNLFGYLAETVFSDGQVLAPTSFGEFDEDSNIWKPIDGLEDLTGGNNGFYFAYEDSANLGNDSFGGTDWAENNITAVAQSTDTPSTNFSTMNSLDNYYAGGTISEGGLQVITRDTGYSYNTSTIGVNSGKWYWEVKWKAQPTGSTNQVQIGIAKRVSASSTTWLGSVAYTYGYQGASGHVQNNDGNASGSVATTYSVGDIISVAMDLDNNKIHFAKNGTYTNSSNPATNSGGVTITAANSTPEDSGFYFAAFGDGNNNLVETGQFNFGSPPYAISSGNADGNNRGNFEYTVPAGFLSLCATNLSEANS